MDSESESESEIPILDGTYENFQIWWTAHAAVCKFEEALKIGGETSIPVIRVEALTASLVSYRKPFD
jgi:hypothetical protein